MWFSLPILFLFGLNITNVASSPLNQSNKHENVTSQIVGFTENALATSTNFNDQLCSNQMLNFLNELRKSQMWAIKVADSWGKLPSGILSGNFFVYGDFDQCLLIAQNSIDSAEETNFYGQYCLSKLKIKLNTIPAAMESITFSVGVCVPETCSPSYLDTIMKTLLEEIGNITQIKNVLSISFDERLCQTATKVEYGPMDIFAIVFFSIIGGLMISSTIYDLVLTWQKKTKSPNLLAFSMYTNGTKLFQCKPNKSPDVMECLNGIRVISMTWVVFGHTYSSFLGRGINSADILTWIQNPFAVVVIAGELAVDTFFLLSGLLVTFSMLKHFDSKNGKLNVPLLYLHRYLRLTPALGAAILFYTTIFRHLLNGPVSKTIDLVGCESYWWSTLLYVQNYVNPNLVCLGPTWYLMVDMQLFIISPIIIYPLWRWRNKFVFTIPLLVLLSMSCTFATYMINHYSVSKIQGQQDDEGKFAKTYVATHTRFGAWGIGVLLGYLLHIFKNNRPRFGNTLVIFGWIVSLGTILAIIFGNYPLNQPDAVTSDLDSAFYESFSRVCWAIAIGWIIFACVCGYGGPINWFLSLPQWQPLARLSYCIYLLHVIVQMVQYGTERTSEYFNNFNAIHKFWGDYGLTLCFSVFWTMAFESPIITLEKMLLGRGNKPNTSNKSQEHLVLEKDTAPPKN